MTIKVLITFAKGDRPEYPLAVQVEGMGRPVEQTTCRNMRDARLYANGVCYGLWAAKVEGAPINPEVDARLQEG